MTETYTVKIQARSKSGDWQTMSVDEVPAENPVDDLPAVTAFALQTGDVPVRPGIVWQPVDMTPEGVGGIPHIRYRAYRTVTAQQVAEDTAANQNIATGDDWRVRVYHGEDDQYGHLAEAGPGAEEIPLAALVERMAKLPQLRGVEHAREAAELRPLVQTALARSRQAAVYEATRGMPWSIVAAELGISEAAINRLVTQHRAGSPR